ncbi:MAG: TIGR00282 family metallophosphoesterase [Beijerinckiaceae bacterium]
MRLLFLGDIVGRPGRNVVTQKLPGLRERWKLDCVVINGENAAGGFGITESICEDVLNAGADVITLGNHAWDQREALVFIERQPRMIRPLNFPPGTPGRGVAVVEARNGGRVLVLNVMGRIYMDPLDDPFAAVERELAACPLGKGCDAIIIDVHAEASSEKQAMGWLADGRASLVVGTHTHVPTSDHRILPGGTAVLGDAGMCGDYDSILGMDRHEPIRRFLQKTPGDRMEASSGEGTLCGVAVETDDRTGLAVKVSAVRIGPHLEGALPAFWE